MKWLLIGIVLLICMPLAGLAACGDDTSDPAYYSKPVDPPDQLGPSGVGYTYFTATDTSREDRPILIDVWYPIDPVDVPGAPPASYPMAAGIGIASDVAVDGQPVSARKDQSLIVFSHGYGSINKQSIELMEALASHGFIIASPQHPMDPDPSSPEYYDEATFDRAAAGRVPDVSFVIDTMVARNRNAGDPFYQRLDEHRVGVIGHSFGAMTAIGMAAGWAGAEADPRVVAIVPISAVIRSDLQEDARTGQNAGFDDAHLSRVVVPVMLMGGTEDTDVPIENNAIAFEGMTHAPRVYQVDVIGANHNHFANVCMFGQLLLDLGLSQEKWSMVGAEALIGPYEAACGPEAFPVDEVSRLLNLYAVSFFKRYLGGEEGYDQYLSQEQADLEPAIRFSVK